MPRQLELTLRVGKHVVDVAALALIGLAIYQGSPEIGVVAGAATSIAIGYRAYNRRQQAK